jgi:hypothetical protein
MPMMGHRERRRRSPAAAVPGARSRSGGWIEQLGFQSDAFGGDDVGAEPGAPGGAEVGEGTTVNDGVKWGDLADAKDQAEDGDAECAAGLLSGSGEAGGPALPSNGYVAEAYRIVDGEDHR